MDSHALVHRVLIVSEILTTVGSGNKVKSLLDSLKHCDKIVLMNLQKNLPYRTNCTPCSEPFMMYNLIFLCKRFIMNKIWYGNSCTV